MNESRGLRKAREGVVVSNAMNKTIVVKVSSRYRHRLYGKEMSRSAKFYAHDEKNEAKVGDEVRIMETKPISRLKRWRLVEVTKRAN